VKIQATERNEDRRIYQVLGSFPCIEKLTVILYHPYPQGKEGNLLPMKFYKTHQAFSPQRLRLALISRAMYVQRTRPIFQLILAANCATRPGVIPSLQHLRLRSIGGGQPWNDLQRLLGWVGCSWIFERRFADVDNDDAIVGEIGMSKRLQLMEDLRETNDERRVWEEIWPDAKGRSYWVEIWHSFP